MGKYNTSDDVCKSCGQMVGNHKYDTDENDRKGNFDGTCSEFVSSNPARSWDRR